MGSQPGAQGVGLCALDRPPADSCFVKTEAALTAVNAEREGKGGRQA